MLTCAGGVCVRRYQESERCGKLGYEDEFLHYLEKIVRDLDRRIERGRERLQKSVSAKQKVRPLYVSSPTLPPISGQFSSGCDLMFGRITFLTSPLS